MPATVTATATALRGDASAHDYTQHLEEWAASLAKVRQLVAEKLAPKVVDVDLKAEYPEAFLRELGAAGGFRGAVAPEYGGNGLGLKHVVQVMEEAAKLCLSTGFLVWCQTACARYIQMSDNEALKKSMLPRIARGDVLVGTGLSNTVKSCDTIEDFRLSAKKVAGGYVINGVLPWVSNLGPTHYFTTGCPVEGEAKGDDGLVFILVDCQQPGFKLVDCAHFVALDGTRTLACHFRDAFVSDAMVLSHPGQSREYVKRIKPGMILAQMGMGLGLIEACVDMMKQANRTHAHVNQFLDDQAEDIDAVLQEARAATYALADTLSANPQADVVLDILKLRLAGGEMSVKAANAAMLHMGAKGYLQKSPAQRRLREAYFIAIVTPATKHLRREIARIEAGTPCPA
ncbi:MAG: acyl-CoA dehydrogenase [Rhodocyclaceae bacterium]|nr:MAG: acyl-CoA dehydrogenase [Rhodocyclaceae bacterium]TND04218.1 MAG: acyl-CoA dehydrogenase [Rhodocyclaceae bacterium]